MTTSRMASGALRAPSSFFALNGRLTVLFSNLAFSKDGRFHGVACRSAWFAGFPNSRRWLAGLTLTFLLPGLLAWASTSGSISGTVKDPVGKVVPGAAIEVREVATGAIHQTQTDSKGYYALP